jgi:hypothetical protein
VPLTNVKPTGAPVPIAGPTTITPSSVGTYYGQTLVWLSAQTLTMINGLPNGFRCRCQPPPSGNASIASDGVTLLNGATSTVTRALALNVLFEIVQIGLDSYAVDGVGGSGVAVTFYYMGF